MEKIFEEVIDRTGLICTVTVHKTLEKRVAEVLNACVLSRKIPIYRSEVGDYVILNATVKKNKKTLLDNTFNMLMGLGILESDLIKNACMGIKFETYKGLKGENE